MQFVNQFQLIFLSIVDEYIKKMKYAYQELPHSEDTASTHSQEEK
jgi:hypothetical protein